MLLFIFKFCIWLFFLLYLLFLLFYKYVWVLFCRCYIFFNGWLLIFWCIDIYVENLWIFFFFLIWNDLNDDILFWNMLFWEYDIFNLNNIFFLLLIIDWFICICRFCLKKVSLLIKILGKFFFWSKNIKSLSFVMNL